MNYASYEESRNGFRRRHVAYEDGVVQEVTGLTPLHLAMVYRHYGSLLVNEHLSNGVHPDIKNRCGDTALHVAIAHRQKVGVFRSLLQHNADVNLQNAYRETPLSLALSRGLDVDVITELCNAGASFTIVNNRGDYPLHVAVKSKLCKASVIESVLRRGIEVDERNKEGRTALIEAVFRSRDIQVIKTLLKYGADVNKRDWRGYSAMHYAISYKDMAAAKLLFKYGANPCPRNLGCCFADENSVFLLIQYLTLQSFGVDVMSPSQHVVWEKILAQLEPSTYFSYDKLKDMYDTCFLELQGMKSDFFNDDFTLYDFVLSNLFENSFQLPEPKLVIQHVFNRINAGRYKNYLKLVFDNFNKQELMQCLLTQFISHTLPCGRVVILSADSLLSIGTYLNEQDMRNLVTAFLRLEE